MESHRIRIRLDESAPIGWRELWQQAQLEGDPKKLEAIVERVNRVLNERENRLATEVPG